MKRFLWLILCLSFSIHLSGQRNADYGIFGGVSSYIGDINTSRLLYSPMPAGGFFYRYNFHPRHALRANIFLGGIQGNDQDFNNNFQQERNDFFSGSVTELAVQFEFNFLPYSTQGGKWDYTPYFAAGIGVAFNDVEANLWDPNNNEHIQISHPVTPVAVIPFSLGFKLRIYKNLGLEAEYGFRKTFYDNFDGLEDLTDPSRKPWLHNNDWYSFTGISFTWKIYNRMAGCPAYSDVDNKRNKR